MSAEVQSQFYLFFLAILWGIGMCLIYDGLRILRHFIDHSTFWLNVEDVLYWIAMTVILFALLFHYNRGEIRSFTIAGLIAGSVFYQMTISQVFISLICWVLTPFFRIFSKIISIFAKFRHFSGE